MHSKSKTKLMLRYIKRRTLWFVLNVSYIESFKTYLPPGRRSKYVYFWERRPLSSVLFCKELPVAYHALSVGYLDMWKRVPIEAEKTKWWPLVKYQQRRLANWINLINYCCFCCSRIWRGQLCLALGTRQLLLLWPRRKWARSMLLKRHRSL